MNTALTGLSCSSNPLNTLDISKNLALKTLSCQSNNLAVLDVSKNIALTNLICSYNQLTSITSMLKLPNLQEVDIRYNNLDCNNWSDLQTLIKQIGEPVFNPPSVRLVSGVAYSPQQDLDPYDCDGTNKENINTWQNFLDPNFKSAVEKFMGVKADGPFTAAEAAQKTGEFDCSGKEIKSLDGIKFLKGIIALNCSKNQLTRLDISKNTAIIKLDCSSNLLTSLNLTKNTALEQLICISNQFSSITSMQNLPKLKFVDIRKNNLDCINWNDVQTLVKQIGEPVIDESNNLQSGVAYSPQKGSDPYRCENTVVTNINTPENFPDSNFRSAVEKFMGVDAGGAFSAEQASNKTGAFECGGSKISSIEGIQFFSGLTSLSCYENDLSTMDLSKNVALKSLNCEFNKLVSLDLSKNVALKTFYGDQNQLKSLEVSNNSALNTLQCDYNYLTSLDVSKCNALELLVCTSNQLNELNVTKNTKLTNLMCDRNQLKSLDLSKNVSLMELRCHDNQIKSLNLSKNNELTICYCDTNELTELDVSNNPKLIIVGCRQNQLKVLDVTKNKALEILGCESNQLTTLDVSKNKALIEFTCSSNQITSITGFVNLPKLKKADISKNRLDCSQWSDVQILIKQIGNPVYDQNKYLKSGVIYSPQQGLDPYDCTIKGIGNINTPENFPDPNFRTAIEIFMGVPTGGTFTAAEAALKAGALDCHNKNIKSLNGIEFFTGLTELNCSMNNFNTLDFSKNISLKTLNCHLNDLYSLDISKNIALEVLTCSWNKLNTLDVSKNTALTELYCYNNNLKTLDIANNTLLTKVSTDYNQLTKLDVSKNIALKELVCGENKLSILDITKNAALTKLSCGENQLSTLDVSKNVALIDLYCGPNKLTELNLSNNPSLKTLTCYINRLTALDVTANTALTILQCNGNTLLSLDVSKNLLLNVLNCTSNQISSIDITMNTALTKLSCSNNNLKMLDIAKNLALSSLECSDNQFTSVANLLTLNKLKILDIRNNKLNCTNWSDVQTLINRIGEPVFDPAIQLLESGVAYSPQKEYDPYTCETFNSANINTSEHFPDKNFRTVIEAYMGVTPGSEFTANDASHKTVDLNCENKNIASLQGIQFFTGITALFCGGNQLTVLDLSKNTALRELNCVSNQLIKLDITQNSELTKLNCSFNQLKALDLSNNVSLTEMMCMSNQISSVASILDLKNIKVADIRENLLNCINWFEVQELMKKIGEPIYDQSNNLRSGIAFSPQQGLDPYKCVKIVTPNINTPENFPDQNFRSIVENFMGVASGGAFSDEQSAIKTGILDCSSNNISSLDGIQFFTGLTKLYCSRNNFKVLDTSKNVALIDLNCDNNLLTTLDLSNNTALKTLNCYYNQLKTLNVLNNSILESINCLHNNLISLDVANCFVLENLTCSINKLSGMDVTRNIFLKKLYCDQNQIKSIDISENTTLNDLSCFSNQIKTLDLSNNIALSQCFCDDNKITELNVSKNKVLKLLACNQNQLLELDVKNAISLEELYCSYNQLPSLDLSMNTKMKRLYCNNNKLSSIESCIKLTGLQRVDISNNLLDCNDWNDLQELIKITGKSVIIQDFLESGVIYSPQKNVKPYDCLLTDIHNWIRY